MRRLELAELDGARAVQLTAAQAAALQQSELVKLEPTSDFGRWMVRPAGYVGAMRVRDGRDDLQIIVHPKISFARLIFLLGYAQRPDFWRSDHVYLAPAPSFPEALTETFIRLAEGAIQQGLLQGYVQIDDALNTVRGRVRVSDQVARHHGLRLPLEVSFDEFSIDIAENQLLLAAAQRLLRVPALSDSQRSRLHRLRLKLADVHVPWRLPDWQPNRLNTRYQPALHVAQLILAGDSFEMQHGELVVNGLIFEMWRIFEDFVCVALREALAKYPGRSELQYRSYLDQARQVSLRPDFYYSDGSRQIVADAKYKAQHPEGYPNADIYQMLAYCTRFELTAGHLIYAKGNEPQARHDVLNSAVRIYCHALDVSLPPADLLANIDRLADQLLAASEPADDSVGQDLSAR